MQLAHQFQGQTVKGQGYRRAGHTVSAEPGGHIACYTGKLLCFGMTSLLTILRQGDLVPGCLRQFMVDSRQVAAVVHQMATHVRLNAARVQQRSTATSTTDDEDGHCCVLDAVLAAASAPTTVDRMCSAGLTHAHLTTLPLEFLSAGSETSSATLIWILRFIVMHPDVQV